MLLVADSGSSKTDWRLIDNKNIQQFECKGLNPNFYSSEGITEEVSTLFLDTLSNEIQSVHFYGAGCSTPQRIQIVREGLEVVFKQADIQVEHDLLGTARATCGKEAGLAAILGTGSNCCLYDGKEIIKEFHSGGYLTSDEGGGVDIGRFILKAFIEDYMPKDLRDIFDHRYKLSIDDILENFYKKPSPNRFIASFAKFAFHHREHPFVSQIIRQSFEGFFEHKVFRFNANDLPLNLVGSIAFYFQEYIRKIGQEKGIQVGTILEKPIAGLSLYHNSLAD